MKQRYLIYILLFMLSAMTVSCDHKPKGEVKRKTILVLTDIDWQSQIDKALQAAIGAEFADTMLYEIDMAYVNSSIPRATDMSYFYDFTERIGHELDKHKENGNPDLIIVLGDNMAYNAALCDHPLLRESPVLCLNVMYPEWRNLIKSRRNFTVMKSKPAIKKNLDFIRALGGESWVVTCLDSTNLDDCLRKSIMDEIGSDTAHYITNLRHETYSKLLVKVKRDTVRTTLIPIDLQHTKSEPQPSDTIYNHGFRVNGLLQCKNNKLCFIRFKDDPYIDWSLKYFLGEYYTQCPHYFNLPLLSAQCGCIGGYFTPWPEMLKQARPTIDQLLEGKDPASIPWREIKRDYWLDWRLAESIHPYAEDFPRYVKFVNLPWRYESRLNEAIYTRWLPASIALVVALAIIIPMVLVIRARRQHKMLVRQGKKATQHKRHIESIMAATHSVWWELMPDGNVMISEDFVKAHAFSRNVIPLDSLLSMHLEPSREQLHKALMDTGKEHIAVNVQVKQPNGETHAFISYVNHFRSQDGEERCYGFTVENDDAYNAEKTRREAFRLMEETDIKESFLAAMSHEIRSPLNAIIGFADILTKHYKELTDEDRHTYAKYITDSKNQLEKLIDHVMQYSRSEGKKLGLELSRKEVSKLMDEIYHTHTVIVPSRLEFRYERGKKAYVKVNRSAVLQIMSNFMNNAIKFTEQGSITLGWTIEDVDGEAFAVMYVEDTGIGIEPRKLRRIFDKFYKTDSHSVGAGLGLSLCKQLATSMNATIKVDSTPGKGSRFSLKAPLRPSGTSPLGEERLVR